jgi:hypothetical protein
MKIYVGNCQPIIDCDQLISSIKTHEVEPFNEFMTLPVGHPYYNAVNDQTVILRNAGYNSNTVEYRHYQSGKHFDKSIEIEFGNIVGAKPLMCWISEIRPGKCTPWHWDVNPWEDEHSKLGEIVRYFCFLSKPSPGHVFLVEKDAYYYEEQGAIYQYPDAHAYHAGTNCGTESKFLFTFTGYR